MAVLTIPQLLEKFGPGDAPRSNDYIDLINTLADDRNAVYFSATAPTDTDANPLWFDTSNNLLFIYNGEWVESSGSGGASITVSDNAPLSPEEGALWYDSSSAKSYIYYDSFWIELAPATQGEQGIQGEPGPTGETGPQGPAGNDGALSPNYIINGAFDIWQRGTSFTPGSNEYTADRYRINNVNGSISQQSFTPADIQAVGFGDAEYFMRLDMTTATTFGRIEQLIEDVRTLAGQEVTFSFWAKADTTESFDVLTRQRFGSGGSSANVQILGTAVLSTSWQRYSVTATLDSMAGKTIGDGSSLQIEIRQREGITYTLDTWGWQLEAGSIATPFKRNANSIAGELAACQRYYEKLEILQGLAGVYRFGTTVRANFTYLVEKRATPSIVASSVNAFGPTGSINSYGFSARVESALIELSMDTTQTVGYSTSVYLDNLEISAEL